MSKFEIYRSEKNQEYYFRLKAKNGENILHSEGYTTKAMCENGVRSVKKNSPTDSNYKRLLSEDERFYFTLNSEDNGQVIGMSQMYTAAASRDNGIESVKENAPEASVLYL